MEDGVEVVGELFVLWGVVSEGVFASWGSGWLGTMTHLPLRALIVLSAGAAMFAMVLLVVIRNVDRGFVEDSY